MCNKIHNLSIGHVNNVPTMQFFTGISRNTQSKPYMLSMTEWVWEFRNDALWDTHYVASFWSFVDALYVPFPMGRNLSFLGISQMIGTVFTAMTGFVRFERLLQHVTATTLAACSMISLAFVNGKVTKYMYVCAHSAHLYLCHGFPS